MNNKLREGKKRSEGFETGTRTPRWVIRYTLAGCPLGRMIVAAREQGTCFIAFDDVDARLQLDLTVRFPDWETYRDDASLAESLVSVRSYFNQPTHEWKLAIDPHGTPFQHNVWNKLREIPPGETTTYTAVARSIGQPTAVRAVARACGANPLALVVPCHRVIARDGSLRGYRWGLERKQALLELEQS